jgi:hypothetical protein
MEMTLKKLRLFIYTQNPKNVHIEVQDYHALIINIFLNFLFVSNTRKTNIKTIKWVTKLFYPTPVYYEL